MPKIIRLVVGRGKTSRPSEQEEWLKRYFEVEMDVTDLTTEDSLDATRLNLEQKLMNWLSEPTPPQLPKLDPSEVAEVLPWTSYHTKKPCTSPTEPGWIFNDPSRLTDDTQRNVFNELAKALEGAEGKLQLGENLYAFSGPKGDPKLFISKRRVK